VTERRRLDRSRTFGMSVPAGARNAYHQDGLVFGIDEMEVISESPKTAPSDPPAAPVVAGDIAPAGEAPVEASPKPPAARRGRPPKAKAQHGLA
jgi:hypothetical protein